MSRRDVYAGEMFRTKFSDSEVERLLSGLEPESDELARLSAALTELHAEHPELPSEETISRLAAEAAEVARSTAPDHDATNKSAPQRRTRGLKGSLRRRLATLATALLTFAGMTGVAFAADSAAPGDTLYGLDRALEQIGVNDGGTAERIEEARTLASSGQVPGAIHHLADTFEQEQGEEESTHMAETADALREAADHVENDNDDLESQEVRSAVATMLEEMAEMFGDTEFDDAVFGQRIADMARQIHSGEGNGEGPPEDIGPPEDAGSTGEQSGRDNESPGDNAPPDDSGAPSGTPGRP